MAARRFSRTDREELTRARRGTLATNGGPSAGNVGGDLSVCAAARHRGMAATDPDQRQSLGYRVRHLPVYQPTPSARAGADKTDTTGALVIRGGDRAWRGIDAGTNLSRAVPSRRPR